MPPRSPPADEALLDAARAVLARGGTLSVAEVARQAGVARGTVYRRFPSPQALAEALRAAGHPVPEAPASPDTRTRLLDAVGAVLRRQGLGGTTLEAVAQEAGVAPVTVYRHFHDRRGLLRAYVGERSPRRLAGSPALEPDADLATGLLALSRESLAFTRAHPGLVLLGLSPDPEAQALLAEAREGTPSVRELAARLIDRHLPDPTGRTVLAFWGLLTFVALGSPGPLDDDARFVVDTFLRGARP